MIPLEVTNVFNIRSAVLANDNNITVNWPGRFILVNYNAEGTYIAKTMTDTITFSAIDNIDAGYTNLVWDSQVSFAGLGDFTNTKAKAGYSQNVSLTMPQPDASACIKPLQIYTVWKSNAFVYVITNKGVGTDRILKARISIPSGFTQITGIRSSIISNDAAHAFQSNNYIILDYEGDGAYIPSQAADRIIFTAFNNITIEDLYDWPSEVNNFGTNWQAADAAFPSGLTVESKIPGYNAKAHIEPNEIESTVMTNHVFTIPIENTGQIGNDIYRVEIHIPFSEFTTNNMSVSSSMISNSYITISSNIIRLDYQNASTAFTQNNFDTITIKIYDTLAYGWANVTWDILCEFNTSYSQYINTGTHFGKSKDVAIVVPNAQASAYIEPASIYTIETNKVFIYKIVNEGSGNNDITEAKIYIPSPVFTNIEPGYVQSSHISNDAAWAQVSGGNVITLQYSRDVNGNLAPGQADTVLINVSISASGPASGILWLSRVTNIQGPSYAYTTVTAGKEQDVDIIEPTFQADAGITPDFIYSTDISNSFIYSIKNDSTSINDKIYFCKIIIPSAVTNVYNIQSSILSDTNSITVNLASNYLRLDYAGEGTNIGKGKQDTITFFAIDNMDSGTNELYWDAKVDFLKGLGYIGTEAGGGYPKNVTVQMPVASASAYIEPEEIYTTDVSNIFTYVITNKGTGTDRILKARISIPSGFTQIRSIQSSIISNDGVYAYALPGSNYILLDYEGDGRHIPAQFADTITFTAYDNITGENSYVWLSKVYNYATNWQDAGAAGPPKSLTVDVIIPGYDANAYIEPGQIESTVTTNHIFIVQITNTGKSGHDIIHAEIYIPLPEFTTNGISAASSTISNSYLTILSNRILLDYQSAGLLITPEGNDTITIKIYDTLNYGWANVFWDVKCEYNTSFGKYIDTGTASGKTKNVSIIMPPAQASAYIEPISLLASETNKVFLYRIINEGSGSNNIVEAKIYVPAPIFSNIGPGHVQSSHISNDASRAQYSGGVITLRYAMDSSGSLVTGKTDIITITALVSASEDTNNIYWLSTVSNRQGPAYSYTSITSNKFQDVDITAIISKAKAGIVPDTIFSTSITNSFVYTITNYSAIAFANKVYYAKIIIPSAITNIYNIQSSILSSTNSITVNWISNFILLDYAAEGTNIEKGKKDIITFTAIDQIDFGFTNLIWNSQVYFTNAIGYVNTKSDGGFKKKVTLVMPDTSASAYIEPEDIYTTSASNSFTYIISNKGFGTDRILKARIAIPTGFTGAANIRSSIIGNDTIYAFFQGDHIILDYEGDLKNIGPGAIDIITFTAYDNITFEDSYIWQSEVYNYATNWQAADAKSPVKTQIVRSEVPGYTARAHIEPNEIDSTVVTNHIFTIPIENTGQSGNNIERAEIFIPLPEFTTNGISVISSIISNSYIAILSNRIRLNYQAAGTVITPGNYDTIIVKTYDTLVYGWANVTWDVKCEFNTTAGQYIDTITHFGRSKQVALLMPEAQASADIEPTSLYDVETNRTFIYRIVNNGIHSNNITEAKIYVPPGIFNIIGSNYIQSSHISNDSAWARYSGNVITLQYAQDNFGSLTTGQTDTVIIDVTVSAPGPVNNILWASKVTNNQGPAYSDTSIAPGKFQDVDIIELTAQARAGIVPGNIYSTSTANDFAYTVENVGNLNDRIYRIRIMLPAEVTNIYNINSALMGTNGITVDLTGNYILVDYDSEAQNILPGDYDIITFTGMDNIDSGTNKLFWDSQADFNNGLGYRDTQTGGGYSKNVVVEMPQAIASAYIRPEEISTTLLSNTFTYFITNKGSGTDRILKARISIPSGFTQIANIQSSIISSNTLYSLSPLGSNYIMLDYSGDGSFIPSRDSDTITFTAYDNITNENTYIWTAEVYNFAPNWQTADAVSPLKTQIVESKHPGYAAKGNIEPNQIESTVATNHVFTIYIENTGLTGNDIYEAEIYIPIPEFITNNMSIASSIISNTYISILSNMIKLDYQSAGIPVAPADYDIIKLKIYDSLDYGWANVTWDIRCKFSTSSGQYIDTGSASWGRSKDVALVMPDAQASAYVEPIALTVSDTNMTLVYRVVNEGNGSNGLTEAKIYIPSSCFSIISPAYVQSSQISNDAAWARHLGNVITLRYAQDAKGNLATSRTDIVFINVDVTAAGATNNVELLSRVTNMQGPVYEYTAVTPGESQSVNIAAIPCAAVNITGFSPSQGEASDTVTITGNGFHSSKGSGSVWFGGHQVIAYISWSSNEIKAIVPVFAVAGPVIVINDCGISQATISNFIIWLPPPIYGGKIIGSIKPNLNVVVSIYNRDTAVILTNFNQNNACVAVTQAFPKPAIFEIDNVMPGNYDIKCSKEGYREAIYMENVSVFSNQVTDIGLIVLRNAIIDANANYVRCIFCFDDDEQSKLCVPIGGALEDFYLDIYIKNMTEKQKNVMNNSKNIIKPGNTNSFKVFNFELEDYTEKSVSKIKLKDECIMTLHYDENFILLKDWNEKGLAIYYWDEIVERWVKLGGTVDTGMNTVQAKIRYLHHYYAVLASPTGKKHIYNVTVVPNPFTPDADSSEFRTAAISFSLLDPQEEVIIKIYNMLSEEVKSFKIDGSNKEGIVWWDAKNENNDYVKDGSYIFQIIAGKNVYTGIMLIIR